MGNLVLLWFTLIRQNSVACTRVVPACCTCTCEGTSAFLIFNFYFLFPSYCDLQAYRLNFVFLLMFSSFGRCRLVHNIIKQCAFFHVSPYCIVTLQGWHHAIFYNWVFQSFFLKKKPKHMRFNKILFYCR